MLRLRVVVYVGIEEKEQKEDKSLNVRRGFLTIETVEIHLMQDCWIGWVSGESVVPEGCFEGSHASVWVVGLLVVKDFFYG